MQSGQSSFLSRPPEAGSRGVRPDIAAVAAIDAKLYVVAMPTRTQLEHENELMLRAIKAAHSSVGLGPDTEIDHVERGGLRSADQFRDVGPVHADVSEAAAVA